MSSSKARTGESDDERLLILTSDDGIEEKEEFLRLMNTYSEMTSHWMLPALHLPMFPYWRDVDIRYPLVDVIDYGDRYHVKVELPGFDKEDVELTLNGSSLEIKAERDLERGTGGSSNCVQRERLRSSFFRVVQFPQEVSSSKASAVLKNGVLEIEVAMVLQNPKELPFDESRSAGKAGTGFP